jgi:protein-S-isoprenylcysteine O-methyltransferase Ste14
MRSTILAYVFLGVFLVGERLLREGDEARTLGTTASDRGTTLQIGVTYGVAINAGWLAQLLSHRGWGRLTHPGFAVVGLLLMTCGLGVKTWAMRTLGRFYTRTLRATATQPVIDTGPYRLVRHPGYLGALLLWIGFGLAVRNWLVALAIGLAMALAYVRRIHHEEAMLVRTLGAPYIAYARRTRRLLPAVY